MKRIVLLLILIIPTALLAQNASYSELESRFTAEYLSHEDSLAFKTTSRQKVRDMLDLAVLYADTGLSDGSRALVLDAFTQLFAADGGAYLNREIEIDFEWLIGFVNGFIEEGPPSSVQLDPWEEEGFLTVWLIEFSDLVLPLGVVLIREDKRIGLRVAQVWVPRLVAMEWARH